MENPTETTTLYAIAFDIGTTNLEAVLTDAETGRTLSRGKLPNPQGEYGADVVTRIERMQKKGRKALANALYGGMRELAAKLLTDVLKPVPDPVRPVPEDAKPAAEAAKPAAEDTEATPDAAAEEREKATDKAPEAAEAAHDTTDAMPDAPMPVFEPPLDAIRTVTVSGNTILEHFAAGLDPSSIAVPPFTPETLFREGESRRLDIFPNADVYFAPCVSGYVGGDIAGGMASIGLADAEELTLFVDVGTNGEIALGNRDGYLTCATAAGPAFSGAGMRGSDLIDAVADLLADRKLMKSGRFAGKDIRAHELTAETARGPKQVSRTAVHNLQLAKGAVRGGIETLLALTDHTAADIGHLIVAGDFGARIDVENAKRIGLLPDIPTERIVQAGNLSLRGARLLLTEEGRKEALRTAELCRTVELSGDDLFAEQYLKQINFIV